MSEQVAEKLEFRRGKSGGEIVSDRPVTPDHSSDPYWQGDGLRDYGGYLVAESVPPELVPLLTTAPALLAACKAQEEAEAHHDSCEECDDGSLCDTGTDLYRKAKTMRQAAIAKTEGRA